MKRKSVCILTAGLVLVWMAVIYGFSGQSGEESSGLSAMIAQPITNALAACWDLEDASALYIQVDGAVRGAAHFGEYTILGFLLMLAISRFGLKGLWLPWLIGTVYAVLDEWHQSFLPGRVCDPKDVLIDTCGVLCGVLLTKLLNKWRKKNVYHQ